jgi:translation initiation factor 5
MYYIQLKKSLPTNQNGMIKGSLSQVEIEKILDEYTETYILCQECKFPELIIDRDGQKLFYVCQACGKILKYLMIDSPN